MATFNGECHIREQIDSLFKQIVLPDELIIADDGSQDATMSVLHSLIEKAPFPVKIIQRKTTLGYARNFSEAALQASNDIVFFCDQDDYWETNKVQIVKQWFNLNPRRSLVIHNIAICDENLNVTIENYFEYLDRNLSKQTFLKGCATAVRKELIDAAFPLPSSSNWHHDNRLHAIAKKRKSLGYIEQVLIKYRVHASQSSGYIIKSKGLGGLLLAKLDQNGLRSLPSWAEPIKQIPLPRTETTLREYLHVSCGQEPSPRLLDALGKIQCSDAVAANLGKKYRITRATKLSKLYLSGGYKNIGRFPQYLADMIRVIKS